MNPQESFINVERCKGIYPQAEFHCEDWVDYCMGDFNHTNIGYIVTDIYVATGGSHFEKIFKASIHLAEKAKISLGEVLLVVNADYGQAKRFQGGTKESFSKETERIFRSCSKLPEFKKIEIHPESVYIYKNEKHSSEMATIITIL